MLPFQELSLIRVAEREKMSVACGSRSCRCLCSKATLLEFCRTDRASVTNQHNHEEAAWSHDPSAPTLSPLTQEVVSLMIFTVT